MTQEQLEQLGKTWQQRLLIHHWDVDYTAIPAQYVDDDGGLSNCEWFGNRLTAAVIVATDHPDAEVESNLIHELLHIVVAPLAFAGYEVSKQLGYEAQRLADVMIQAETERVVRCLERVIAGTV
jgi:hypothetical protein